MAYHQIVFSPTGGTKKCADILAAGIADQWKEIDLTTPIHESELTSEDICIAAVPSFGGRVPDLAANRLNQLHGNGAKAVLLCVYGNRAFEDTLVELQDILTQRGFICIAAVSALAEHSIMHSFAAGRPDGEDTVILTNYASAIAARLNAPVSPLILPGNRPYKEYKVAPMVPLTGDNCVGCGICDEKCPAGAISDHRINPEKCICCMRCTSVCPVGAKHLNPVHIASLVERLKNALGGHKENQLFL